MDIVHHMSIYDIIVNTVMMNITSIGKVYWMLMASDPGLNGLYSIRMKSMRWAT